MVYLVVVHEDGQLVLEGLHEVLEQVHLAVVAVLKGVGANVDGLAHSRLVEVLGVVGKGRRIDREQN